jgi:hypothetical protein
LGILQKKNCRHDIFDEFYPFLSKNSHRNQQIPSKKIVNMGVLKFTPSIFGKTRGNPAKWLGSSESSSASFNLLETYILIIAIDKKILKL